jgi:hypothetical protein|tara:strand:- start:82 stop:291 length:210 start_codon:yes stop_codon:yes gene_type:complete
MKKNDKEDTYYFGGYNSRGSSISIMATTPERLAALEIKTKWILYILIGHVGVDAAIDAWPPLLALIATL